MRWWYGRAVLAVACVVVLAPALDAQVIRGTVTSNGAPLVDASVVLLDDDGNIRRGTLSEQNGTYELMCPGPGTYVVRVGGAGIPTWNSEPVTVGDGETVALDIPLGSATGGPPVFERRRASTEGTFLTEQDIRDRTANEFTRVLEHIPGVRVLRTREFNTVRLEGARPNTAIGARQRGEPGDDCPPELFVNNEWWGPLDEASDRGPDLVLLPENLIGIEIYTPTVVPDELRATAEAEWCGVVVVWEKEKRN